MTRKPPRKNSYICWTFVITLILIWKKLFGIKKKSTREELGNNCYNNHMPPNNLPKYIPGEEIIFEIRPSFFILASQILALVVGTGFLLALFYFSTLATPIFYIVVGFVGIFIAGILFLNWRAAVYRLTNKRVENRVGFFGSREEEISHDDIQAVDVQQSNVGKIFNFGTVMIKAAGASREVDFTNVASPKQIANRIEDLAILASRRKRPAVSPQ